jgi:hypothetical protein
MFGSKGILETPPPCTFYYLAVCKQGIKCTYGHDYILTPTNYTELRENAKKSPCSLVNRSTSSLEPSHQVLNNFQTRSALPGTTAALAISVLGAKIAPFINE